MIFFILNLNNQVRILYSQTSHFGNWKWKLLSPVWLFETPWTIVHGILEARILEWVAFSFARGSSQLRDQTQVSRITGRFFTSWATREAQDEGKRGGKLSDLRAWWTKMQSTPGYRKELVANGLPFHMSTRIDWWWLSAGGLARSVKGRR